MFPNQVARRARKPRSVLLLLAPLTAVGLGFWQLDRLKWKKNLMARLDEQLHEEPISFPDNLDEVRNLEYRRVRVQGSFDHSQEFLVGPRTLLREMGVDQDPVVGVHVITPFKLASTGQSILVNRGFVPDSIRKQNRVPDSQADGESSFNAIVRLPAKKAPFVPDNDPEHNAWHWIDCETMSKIAGTHPVLVDLCADATPPSGFPAGGQTQIVIRNHHLEYCVTWFSLAAAMVGMWFM